MSSVRIREKLLSWQRQRQLRHSDDLLRRTRSQSCLSGQSLTELAAAYTASRVVH